MSNRSGCWDAGSKNGVILDYFAVYAETANLLVTHFFLLLSFSQAKPSQTNQRSLHTFHLGENVCGSCLLGLMGSEIVYLLTRFYDMFAMSSLWVFSSDAANLIFAVHFYPVYDGIRIT